jgi:formylmethanofuran dehydrogenase subunit E
MIESVKQQIYGVLDKYDKKYTPSGVAANLERWRQNKGWLVELLRRHPNWNEEALAVIFDVTESREIDAYLVNSYRNDVLDLCADSDTPEIDRDNFRMSLATAIAPYSKNIANDRIVSDIRQYSDISCAVGQKTSRVINKICQKYGLDKNPEYNSRFARLADSLNPLKIRRKAMLSVHPCDYLEMSNRDNSWTSCHCLDEGAYHGGTLSYMNDECSMIFCTVDDDVDGDFYQAPKRSRQVFCFNSGILLQSRLYPNTDDEEARNTYRNIVQHVIADCLALPNLWILKREDNEMSRRVETFEDSLHYPDYLYSCNKANVSILKDALVEESQYILIGHTAYCLNCSEPISETNRLHCDNCADSDLYTCYECGARVDEDDIHYVNGEYYCDECCYFCEHCHEYTTNEVTSVYNRQGRLISVCNSCRDEHYYYCEDCEEYHHYDNGVSLDDGFHCDACLSREYLKCESCGEYVHRDDANKVGGDYYCSFCAEGLIAETEKEPVTALICMGEAV